MDRRNQYVFSPETSEYWETIRLINKKWNRLILEHLLVDGPSRFSQLKRDIDDISDKALSESLKQLEEADLVERTVKDTRPVEVEYSLTEIGTRLGPVMETISDWLVEYHDERGSDLE